MMMMSIDPDYDDWCRWWRLMMTSLCKGRGRLWRVQRNLVTRVRVPPAIACHQHQLLSLVVVKDDYRSSWSDALIIFMDHSITGQTRADLRTQPQLQQLFSTMRYSQQGWLNCGVSLLRIVFFFLAHSCSFWLTPSLWLWLFLAYCGSQGSCSARYSAAA